MATRCPHCNKNCNNTYAIACNKCDKWYHCDCAKITKSKLTSYEKELKNPNGERWFCEPCKSEVNDKIMIPENNTKNKKKYATNAVSNDNNDNNEITLQDIMDKLQIIEKKQSDLLERYEEQLQINDELKQEIKVLKVDLQKEKNKNEQYELRKNIIITGIPRTNNNEKVTYTLKTICETLNLDISPTKCFRIGKAESKAAPIKVCFKNMQDKELFLQAKKGIKMTPKSMGINNSEEPIFANHELTKHNQYIYMLARKFKRDNNYKFIWISEGNIFLRKDEKSKILNIQDESDLKNYHCMVNNQED